MREKIRILFLSANPWTTSRILVDEEAREIFERLQEGPYREMFELYKHEAIRAIDLQRFLMMYQPHIVHFSGHGSKTHRVILGGMPGRGKEIDRQGLVEMFALYKSHLRLVLFNACFTDAQARSLSTVIDFAVGTGRGIGDKAGVAFAGAFYRALGFGKSVKAAFASARAELALTRMPRARGIELFVRDGIREDDPFPQTVATLESASGNSKSLNGYLFSSGPIEQEGSEGEVFQYETLVCQKAIKGPAKRATLKAFGLRRLTRRLVRQKDCLADLRDEKIQVAIKPNGQGIERPPSKRNHQRQKHRRHADEIGSREPSRPAR